MLVIWTFSEAFQVGLSPVGSLQGVSGLREDPDVRGGAEAG